MKKEAEKILEYKNLLTETAQMEYEFEGDTDNYRCNGKFIIVISKALYDERFKHYSAKVRRAVILGRAHILRKIFNEGLH
jgi:hypothetical protein